MLERAAERHCAIAQCFVSSPRTWKTNPIVAPDPEVLAALRARLGVEVVVVHASYLINLASPDRQLRTRSVELLRWTMEAAATIGADAVVVHAGASRGEPPQVARERVREGLVRVLAATTRVELLVENPASGEVASSIEGLASLLEGLDPARTGACLDTQHLFAAGIALTDSAAREEVVTRMLEADLPLRLWHLNDSLSACGSHRDRHANLGEGAIGLEALVALVADPRLPEADAVLEVPGAGQGPRLEDVVGALRALGLEESLATHL